MPWQAPKARKMTITVTELVWWHAHIYAHLLEIVWRTLAFVKHLEKNNNDLYIDCSGNAISVGDGNDDDDRKMQAIFERVCSSFARDNDAYVKICVKKFWSGYVFQNVISSCLSLHYMLSSTGNHFPAPPRCLSQSLFTITLSSAIVHSDFPFA